MATELMCSRSVDMNSAARCQLATQPAQNIRWCGVLLLGAHQSSKSTSSGTAQIQHVCTYHGRLTDLLKTRFAHVPMSRPLDQPGAAISCTAAQHQQWQQLM
jgi:hypothetical protein